MFKKIFGVMLSLIMISAVCCMPSSAETYDVREGDTVQYIFSIGAADNVAGVAVDSWYNAECLTPVDGYMTEVTGIVNINYAVGAMKWNFTYYGGRAFNGEDVVTITFNAIKSCNMSDLGLSYNCVECFNHDLQPVVENFNSLVTARTVVIPTGERVDETTESETVVSEPETDSVIEAASTDTQSDKSVDSGSDVGSEKDDKTSDSEASNDEKTDSTAVADSEKNSDSDKKKSSDSEKSTDDSDSADKSTPTGPSVTVSSDSSASVGTETISSEADSDENETKNSPSSEKSTSSDKAKSSNASTVQTAGTIAITSLAVVLLGAAGVVFFTKKKREIE